MGSGFWDNASWQVSAMSHVEETWPREKVGFVVVLGSGLRDYGLGYVVFGFRV